MDIFPMDDAADVSAADEEAYIDAIRRRAERIPLQHITGQQEFMGLTFKVNENVLIPRQDTEILVEEVMREMQDYSRILDMCTGSGAIGVSVKRLCPKAKVTLTDLSRDALDVVRKNAHDLNVDVEIRQGDLFKAVGKDKFDLIVSNPPYITTEEMKTLDASVKDYEPHLALCGGDDGLVFYRAIVENFTSALRPCGLLAFEFGEGQGDDICAILKDNGYTILERVRDFNDTERALLARYDRKEE